MKTSQEIVEILLLLIIMFFSIDATICGFFGLTSGNVSRMPRLLIRRFLSGIEVGWGKYRGDNKIAESLLSFKAISLYFIIGGSQVFFFCLDSITRRIIK